MAASRASFIPSFVNAMSNMSVQFNAPTVQKTKAFDTSRTGKDRISDPVTLEAMHYDQATSSIKVFCSDGNLRECRVQRLADREVGGRALWAKLQAAGKNKTPVQFIAAGGFSPDKWFYAVE